MGFWDGRRGRGCCVSSVGQYRDSPAFFSASVRSFQFSFMRSRRAIHRSACSRDGMLSHLFSMLASVGFEMAWPEAARQSVEGFAAVRSRARDDEVRIMVDGSVARDAEREGRWVQLSRRCGWRACRARGDRTRGVSRWLLWEVKSYTTSFFWGECASASGLEVVV